METVAKPRARRKAPARSPDTARPAPKRDDKPGLKPYEQKQGGELLLAWGAAIKAARTMRKAMRRLAEAVDGCGPTALEAVVGSQDAVKIVLEDMYGLEFLAVSLDRGLDFCCNCPRAADALAGYLPTYTDLHPGLLEKWKEWIAADLAEFGLLLPDSIRNAVA